MERIINIKIFKSGKIDMDTMHWGVQNEKNITKLLFTFPEELESYNKEILFDFGMGKVVPDLIQNNQYTIDNNVSCYTNIDVAVRVTKPDGTKLFESLPEAVEFDKSLEPTDDMPTSEQVSEFNTMITTLNEKITEVEEAKEGIANINISAVKEGNITTITITKADGTQENFEIKDGEGGGKGTSNFENLENKPSINDVELNGNKTLEELGIQPSGSYATEEYVDKKIDDIDVNVNLEDLENIVIKDMVDTQDVMLEDEIRTVAENELYGQYVVKPDGTITAVSWNAKAYIYRNISDYDLVTARIFATASYPIVFFDENDNFVSSYSDGLGSSGAWVTLENVPIPENASYFYITMTAGSSQTITLIKNAVYGEKVIINEENLNEDIKEKVNSAASIDFVNKKAIRLPQFMNWKYPGQYGVLSQFAVDGRYVYISRHGYLYKVDVSCENTPVLVAECQFSKYITAASDTNTKSTTTTGMVVNGDYLYVGSRLSAAARPTEVQMTEKSAGSLFIFEKKTLNPIDPVTGEVIDKDAEITDTTNAYIPLGVKVSDVNVHGNSLIVNGQMRRWDIYDITDPRIPVILTEDVIEDFTTEASIEVQKGEVFEFGDKVYYAVAGFADGVWLFDITDPANPTQVWKYEFKGNESWSSKLHTYGITVNYPYIYATIAPDKTSITDYPYQGVLTLKIDESDISIVPTESKLSLISTEDMNSISTSTDAMPTQIVRMGNILIINNEIKGIAIFDTTYNPQQPDYEGLYKPSDNCLIYRMKVTPDGRLFLADYLTAGRLYLVRGLSNKNDRPADENADNTGYVSDEVKKYLTEAGYVKNTDYATATKGGVFRIYEGYATGISGGYLIPKEKTYEQYLAANNNMFVGKHTLENVIAGKELTSKTDVNTILDSSVRYFDNVNADEPDITIEITEDCSLVYINTDNNGESFDFEEIMGTFELQGITATAEGRMTFAPKEITASYSGLIIANTNGSTTNTTQAGVFKVSKDNLRSWYTEYNSNVKSSWLGGNSNIGRHIINANLSGNTWSDITSIKEFTIMPYSGSFHAGSIIKIWGRSAE